MCRFAGYADIWYKRKHLVIHIARNHNQWRNCEIVIDIYVLNHPNHMTQLFSKLFTKQLTRIRILYIIGFIKMIDV